MSTATADVVASLNSLLTRLQALPPPPHQQQQQGATEAAGRSLVSSLSALAAQLKQLSSSSRPPSLPTALLATLTSLFQYTPSEESEEQLKLALEGVRTVVEWIVLRELRAGEKQGKQWGEVLWKVLGVVNTHLERTEELDSSGSATKDQPYRTLVASILNPTLVKLVIPAPDEGWTKEVVEAVPDFARYAALDIFNDLLTKHAPNKALARKLLPASSLARLLHASTDFHLSQSAMEIAYRTVPPFNRHSLSSDDPKRQWVDQLFPPELFGTDAKVFRGRFYELTGKSYFEEMPEILKLMSLGSVKRSQPFMAHSLIFNNRTLITPENETEIWFCHHSILALINLEGEGGESYDERFHLAISDVKAIEMENAPEGDEDFIVIEMILNSPPHLGSTLLNDPPAGEQGHHRLIIKTTTRGSAFGILKKTMEERAWRYPALTPHPTSSGTSTSSRPTILNPPPPPLAGAQPSINGHAPAHKDKKPRSSQAGPIVGVFKGPPPPPPQSVNGDLDTPVFEKDEESQTIKRGKVLAAMAELPEDLASEAGGSKGEESGEEEEEDGVGELVSGQVEQVVQEEEESAEKMVQERQQEVDAGELSSDLSSIEDSDKEVEVKVNATKTRQPSKVSSSRKSTTTTTTTAKSVVVNVGSPLPPPRAPSKRRSPRLTPPPPKQQQQQRQARELTESIEEESLDRNPKPPPVVDEIVDVDSESLPNPRARKAAAPRPSSTNPENKEKEKTVSSRRPKRTSTKAKEVVVQSAVAEPAAIAVPLRKRVRSPSPSSIPVPIASPPRQKTKTTIMDEPAYPKRRKVTDASPVDEEAPYETTLEVEEKKSSGRYTLQEKKKSGVPTPRKKYGRERKERKVAEGVKMSKVGAKGKGKKKQEESASEDEDEDEEQEVVVSESKGKKKAAESKKPATDFDSLPHVKPKKTNVKDTLKTTTKSKMKAKTAASDAPISASTTKSTKLAASRATRAAEKKEAIERATTKKKAASKSKKAETFSQLVATPPAASPLHSPSPAPRPISQIDDSESQQEKFDFDFGPDPDVAPQLPSPQPQPVQHPPTPVTDGPQHQQPKVQVVEDAQKSTGSLPLDPALDPSFVKNALGEEQVPPTAKKDEQRKRKDEPRELQREEVVEEVGGRAEQQQVERKSPEVEVEVEVEVEKEQPAQIVEDGPQAMELDEQPPPPQAQPKDDRASRSPSPPAEIEEQQHEDPPQVGLRLGDHILGPTPAQEEPEEHGQDFTIAAEEEEAVVEVNAEGADDEGAEEGLQALDADVESGAEDAVEVREFDGEEMVVDGVGEDSGFFPAEDEQEEGVVAQEQPKHALAVPVELVPNTSSLPQPSFEKPIRAQPALKVNPVIQPSPQLKKTSNLLPRLSPLIAKTNPPRPPRISLLANQANRNRPAVFSSPRPAPKALVPPRPPRRASSEPPSGRREGGEGSPRARARSHGRHSEPEPKRMKEKQGRGKSKTRSRESAGRSKGKERERAVHADEEETVGDGYEQDFAQELRAQLDEMVDYIVLKVQARRLASAQAFESSKRRIKRQFAKGAESMHENTVAVAAASRAQVEQLQSTPVKFAALRDRQRTMNKAMEAELSKK